VSKYIHAVCGFIRDFGVLDHRSWTESPLPFEINLGKPASARVRWVRVKRWSDTDHASVPQQITKSEDGVARVFYQLMFGLISNVLRSDQHRLDDSNGVAHDFFTMKCDGGCDLPFAILVSNALRQAVLSGFGDLCEGNKHGRAQTLVNTATDAYEFPKLIPITGGRDDASVDSRLATPFGGAFAAIVAVWTVTEFFAAGSPGPVTQGVAVPTIPIMSDSKPWLKVSQPSPHVLHIELAR
jgi:hypothetical protein